MNRLRSPDLLIRFWKPYGVVSAFTDHDGHATLAAYIDVPGVYPAGRLDHDSEGLLLLTGNGRAQARLTDPAHAHPRTYYVQVEGEPTPERLAALERGVLLRDGPGRPPQLTRPAQARGLAGPGEEVQVGGRPLLERTEAPIADHRLGRAHWLALTLTEGRNRQVRRMTAAVGLPCLRLVRVAIGVGAGAVTLDGLTPGAWEPLDMRRVLGR
jgi:23S rRNA pseudouridine2457 synthase